MRPILRHTLIPLLVTALVLPAICASANAETAPAQTAPAQTAPAQTAPAQTAPAQTAPAQKVSKDADTSHLSPRARRTLRRRKLTQDLALKGEAELRKSVRVFQQRYLVKSMRVELVLGGSIAIGDPLIDTRNLDAGLLFHINQNWAIGATGFYSFAAPNDAFENIQRDFGLFPERSLLQAGGFGEVQFSPIFGKFSSFGMAVLQMDVYFIGAVGAVRTTVKTEAQPAWQVGAGLRIHALRALTLSFEIRDTMMNEKFQAGDRLMQHWFGGIKIGLWIPPTFDYKHQR
jgi:outer membrane beta-barrel protein